MTAYAQLYRRSITVGLGQTLSWAAPLLPSVELPIIATIKLANQHHALIKYWHTPCGLWQGHQWQAGCLSTNTKP
jgi:hypothetical protein